MINKKGINFITLHLQKTASQKHPLQTCCAKEIKLKSLDVKAGVFPYEVRFHFNETWCRWKWPESINFSDTFDAHLAVPACFLVMHNH